MWIARLLGYSIFGYSIVAATLALGDDDLSVAIGYLIAAVVGLWIATLRAVE